MQTETITVDLGLPGLEVLDSAEFPDRNRTAEKVVTIMHPLWPDKDADRHEREKD